MNANEQLSESEREERTARRFWGSVVISLLGMQIVLGVIAINLAVGEPSAMAVPDYHTQALRWDETWAERTAADRMGLKVNVYMAFDPEQLDRQVVCVEVTDADGKPVNGLMLAASAFHHKYPGEVIELGFHSIAEGRYVSDLPLLRGGIWSVDVTFPQQGETVSEVCELDVQL